MRRILGPALAVGALAVASVALPAAPASAAGCSPKTDRVDTRSVGGNDYGVVAWCERGSGHIRAKAVCISERTLREYTVVGNRVWSKKFVGDYMSAAWCRTGDAVERKSYVLG
jgi:hypothetical protein